MRKKQPHRKKSERRSYFGELLEFDGSYHDWFEGRGEPFKRIIQNINIRLTFIKEKSTMKHLYFYYLHLPSILNKYFSFINFLFPLLKLITLNN